MKLSNNVQAKSYVNAPLCSLLVGSFRAEDGNFFAIRAESKAGKNPGPYMVILTPSVDDEKLPYVCQPHTPPNVLGLGTDWYIDVAVGKSSPYMFRAFRQDPMAVLLRCDGNYFLELKDGWLLDLADGSLITAAPTQSPLVSWAAFSICMSAEPPEEDTVVFRWPADA